MNAAVVDEIRNDNDKDEDQVEHHLDGNVVNENREDEEFDVRNAVNFLVVADVVVKVVFVVDVIDRGVSEMKAT